MYEKGTPFRINVTPTSIAVLSAAAFASYLVIYWFQGKRKPKTYRYAAKVRKIVIYPVKSLAGIEVNKAVVSKTGLQYDDFRDR